MAALSAVSLVFYKVVNDFYTATILFKLQKCIDGTCILIGDVWSLTVFNMSSPPLSYPCHFWFIVLFSFSVYFYVAGVYVGNYFAASIYILFWGQLQPALWCVCFLIHWRPIGDLELSFFSPVGLLCLWLIHHMHSLYVCLPFQGPLLGRKWDKDVYKS